MKYRIVGRRCVRDELGDAEASLGRMKAIAAPSIIVIRNIRALLGLDAIINQIVHSSELFERSRPARFARDRPGADRSVSTGHLYAPFSIWFHKAF